VSGPTVAPQCGQPLGVRLLGQVEYRAPRQSGFSSICGYVATSLVSQENFAVPISCGSI
jgi:hypothetical protein